MAATGPSAPQLAAASHPCGSLVHRRAGTEPRDVIPGGDGGQLKESIRRIGQLESAWLLPGHGAVVSGTEAVAANFASVEQNWFDYV